jgi:hypothetical protein
VRDDGRWAYASGRAVTREELLHDR